MEIAAEAARENAELMRLLDRNLARVKRNRYSLEVFRTLAMLGRGEPNAATKIATDRERVLRELTTVWGKTWYPRVAEANGPRFLHELDDIKDHAPDRTVDMSYLVERELRLEITR